MISSRVKKSAQFIMTKPEHVHINMDKLNSSAEWLHANRNFDAFAKSSNHPTEEDHLDIEAYLFFMFATDAMNFCFWVSDKEYEDLTAFLKTHIKNGDLSIQKILVMGYKDFVTLFSQVFTTDSADQLEERYRILKELSEIVINDFNSSFKTLLIKTGMDAKNLLKLVVEKFVSFQDHCIYKGRQVFFYKRAQILVADVSEALKTLYLYKKALPAEDADFADTYNFKDGLSDISTLTCFADYRVPQVLHMIGLVEYSADLQSKLENKIVIANGSGEECEIRAAMIHSIEFLKEKYKEIYGSELISVEIDWIMWQYAEKNLKDTYPFHRTIGIYY